MVTRNCLPAEAHRTGWIPTITTGGIISITITSYINSKSHVVVNWSSVFAYDHRNAVDQGNVPVNCMATGYYLAQASGRISKRLGDGIVCACWCCRDWITVTRSLQDSQPQHWRSESCTPPPDLS